LLAKSSCLFASIFSAYFSIAFFYANSLYYYKDKACFSASAYSCNAFSNASFSYKAFSEAVAAAFSASILKFLI